jgi:hypothetical protein
MSQIVNIVVEGAKDAYFIHEFIRRRFGHIVDQAVPAPAKALSYNNGEPMEFVHRQKRDNYYRICVNNGYNNEGSMKKFIEDTDSNRSLVCTVVLFDADTTGDTEDSGFDHRRKFIDDQIASLQKQLSGSKLPTAKNIVIYLFPDNKSDGDLESVMKGMALPMHRPFFVVCWRVLQCLLRAFNYLQLSNKSMIYDYVEAMYEKTNKVARVKDKQGYNKNLKAEGLWNWNSRSLNPLVAFFDSMFSIY